MLQSKLDVKYHQKFQKKKILNSLFGRFEVLTNSNSDNFQFWQIPILTKSNSDKFQFWQIPILRNSNSDKF